MTSTTLITGYLAEGTAASRPATPAIPAGCLAFYYETDTETFSFYDLSTSSWISLSGTLTSIPSGDVLSNITSGSALPVGNSLSSVMDKIGSTQGSILFRSSTGWQALTPGTSGQVLETQGTGANPVWATVSGSLPSIAPNDLLANLTGSTATPTGVTLSALLNTLSSTEGAVLYCGASGWTALTPGTSGQVLTTGGTGAVPTWTTVTGSLPSIGSNDLLANLTGSTAAPTGVTLTATLDTLTTTQGSVLYRGASSWVPLAPGTSGQVLTSGGSAANLSWTTVSGGGGSSTTLNKQTGTTYTVQTTDAGAVIRFSSASGVAVTLPAATTTGFGSGFSTKIQFVGTGNLTITPTTSTIDGLSSLKISNGGAMQIISDGTNYFTISENNFYSYNNSAFSLNIPDSTTANGDARGAGAVDLQTTRSNANQVAFGAQSFVAGANNAANGSQSMAVGYGNTASALGGVALGYSNTASSQASVALGQGNSVTGLAGIGYNNSVSGSNAVGVGLSCTASGPNSFVFGTSALDNGNEGQFAFGFVENSIYGASTIQHRENVFSIASNGSAAVRLTAKQQGAGSATVGALPNYTFMMWQAEFIAIDTATSASIMYTFGPSVIFKGGNAASTVMGTGNPAAVAGPTVGSPPALGAAPTITADTTYGGFNVSVTPPSGNTTNWYYVCRIYGTEIISYP